MNTDEAHGLGYDRHWFSLPWFDRLRKDPAFRKLIDTPAAVTP